MRVAEEEITGYMCTDVRQVTLPQQIGHDLEPEHGAEGDRIAAHAHHLTGTRDQ